GFDFVAEWSMVRSELWTYTQASGPVIHFGSQQWPVLWEPLLFVPVLAVTSVMLLRDDAGVTAIERFVVRHRRLGARPIASQILVAFVVYAILYAGLYGGGMSLLRMTGQATNVQQQIPYGEMKTYDPQGRYQKAGVQGPYYAGNWSGLW
ncbi:MAG TPA: spirocyclase AveC family protein, partial [Acidimicrobiales bacterium]